MKKLIVIAVMTTLWLGAFIASALPPLDVTNILFTKQEEKLARDVYQSMFDRWGHMIFRNIVQSEQRHMNEVDGLITYYQLVDPTPAQPGVFTIPELQALHDQLVAKGNRTLIDALLVGIIIEETDIRDVQLAINGTRESLIRTVLGNLLAGSSNHLTAFNGVLAPIYTRLAAPTLTVSAFGAGFLLTWTDLADNEQAFGIERRRHGTESWERIGEVAANTTAFTDATPPLEIAFYRVMATNTYEVGLSSSSAMALQAFTSYSAWRDAAFAEAERATLGLPWADPDGDGVANFAEYFAGQHPRVPVPGPAVSSLEAGRLVTRIYRRMGVNDAALRYETSASLTNWQAGDGVEEVVMATGPGAQQLEVRLPVSGLGTLFLRVGAEPQ